MPKKGDFFARFGARLDIPREALPGSFGITLAGQEELTVRGCKRIVSFGEQEIRLAVGKSLLVILGDGLLCSAFGAGCVTVTGKIAALMFEGGTQ